MKTYRLVWTAIFASLGALSQAQVWSASYGDGLRDAAEHKWQDARAAFLDASADRTDDSANPTTLSDGSKWRDGAPYSPNFLAAFCGIKAGLQMSDPALQNTQLEACANELWALVDRGQVCRETVFYLNWSLNKLGESDRVDALRGKLRKLGSSTQWKVDDTPIDPQELTAMPGDLNTSTMATLPAKAPVSHVPPAPQRPIATPTPVAVNPAPASQSSVQHVPIPMASTEPMAPTATTQPDPMKLTPQVTSPPAPISTPPPSATQPPPVETQAKPQKHRKEKAPRPGTPIPAADIDPVTGAPLLTVSETPTDLPNVSVISLSKGTVGDLTPTRPDKFALIIANNESRIGADFATPFASNDAEAVQETLTRAAGYSPDNVSSVVNGTVQQIKEAAAALASRVSDSNVVTIYFVGAGQSIGGRDYLAGVDSTQPDPSQLLAKDDLFQVFVTKGARVFAFFEVNRPQENGSYFGTEIPDLGAVAQMEATVAGDPVTPTVRDGKNLGLFTDAFIGVLNAWHSNQNPIMDFGWEVFKRIRGGDTGTIGGGSSQTPTLPILKNIASDARF